MEKKIDSFGQLEYWLLDNGILKVQSTQNLAKTQELSLEEIKHSLAVQQKVYEMTSKKVRMLADLASMSKLSTEARQYGKTAESQKATECVLGYALLASSLFSRMTGNILLGLYQQKYPVKLFKTEEQAIAWLLNLED
ncbi:STAS/SEC14 domain-containing protein [Saprospira grandis]|uniref:DUF7793 family protein n=1 Tax=Saprospira grandis TaxID=1008 RepID=UPI0022DD457D|nr:STAS/SEC14 domain-containing protein [Saprospira grandis]WBM75062.1 STAS/SEC14 domain-containing protein [Saprospira grandis]